VDVCARRVLARSELEAGRDRGRSIAGASAMPTLGGILLRVLVKATALAACPAVAAAGDLERLKLVDSQIEPIAWAELDGWAADHHAAAFAAFRASCTNIVRQRARDERPMLTALKGACKPALAAGVLSDARARSFFEENFRPARIAKLGEKSGLLTGYYE